MREFLDKDRKVAMLYYDIEEQYTGNNFKIIKRKIEKLINEDPYYLDSYLFLKNILEDNEIIDETEKILETAYQKALELILDKNGNWPDKLEWGWLENRHIIRTLINKGIDYWKNNENKKALDLFNKLLETNPNDNGGVRYLILGIKEGMSEDEFNNKFDKGGYWDQEIDIWFNKNINKYEEYKWWINLFK